MAKKKKDEPKEMPKEGADDTVVVADETMEMTQLIPMFELPAFGSSDESKLRMAIQTMAIFAQVDAETETTSPTVGAIFHAILAHPVEDIRWLTNHAAQVLGVPAPEWPALDQRVGRGRPTTGRLQLAHTFYGLSPELCVVKAGENDSRAGKRVSYHIRSYRLAAGLIEQTAKPKERQELLPGILIPHKRNFYQPRRAHELYLLLALAAENEREERMLVKLCLKAKVDPSLQARWNSLLPAEEEQQQGDGEEGQQAIS